MGASQRFRCFSRGRWTDEVSEGGPSAEDAGQERRWTTGVLDVHGEGGPCRAAVACWPCFWATDPDLWILPTHWDALNPLIPSEKLPLLDHDSVLGSDPASYPWPGG